MMMMMMMIRFLLPALLFFLTGPSLVMYGVSAQTSAATCTTSLQALTTACGTDTATLATCCPVYQTQVNAYYDCYCSANTTTFLQLATACSFTLPQNLTSCFPPATPPSPSPTSPPPPPPSPSPSPSPSPTSPPGSSNTTTVTCDAAWEALLTACVNGTASQCCDEISSSMTATPSCYCEFTSLNITVFYSLVGPDTCNLAVPPTVSACLAALSPPPPPLTSPPPPPPTTTTTTRSPPPPTTTTTTTRSPPPPPLIATTSSPPPPPLSNTPTLIGNGVGAISLPTSTHTLLITMLIITILPLLPLPFFM